MASSLEYVQHVAAQLSGAGAISYKKLFHIFYSVLGHFKINTLRTYSIQVFKVAFIIGCSLDWILFIKLSLLFLPRALYYKKV